MCAVGGATGFGTGAAAALQLAHDRRDLGACLLEGGLQIRLHGRERGLAAAAQRRQVSLVALACGLAGGAHARRGVALDLELLAQLG